MVPGDVSSLEPGHGRKTVMDTPVPDRTPGVREAPSLNMRLGPAQVKKTAEPSMLLKTGWFLEEKPLGEISLRPQNL